MNTKRSLLFSIVSLILCVAMLAGTTFAWFTDSVTSGKNTIVAGNLDVELEYLNEDGEWTSVQSKTDLFDENAHWEPGYTHTVYLRVRNLGSLSLKYRLGLNIADEVGSTNVNGEEFKLSDYIKFGVVEDVTEPFENRASARNALIDVKLIREGYTKENVIPAKGDDQYVALVVYMPEEVGNEANHKTGYAAPTIELGVTLVATQFNGESDSFGDNYDENAAADFFPGFQGGSAGVTVNTDDQGVTTTEAAVNAGDVSAVIPAGVQVADGITSLGLTVTNKNSSEANLQLGENEKMSPLDVHIEGVAEGNTTPMLITLKQYMTIGINTGAIKMYHVENGVTVPMTHVANPVNHNEFSYDPSTGDVTLALASFSEVAVVADTNNPWDGETFDYSWYNASATVLTIYNADQLAAFGAIVDGKAEGIAQDSFAGKTVKLNNNIYLSGKLFDPIGWGYVNTGWNRDGIDGKVFQGTFDGNGKTIFDLYQSGWDLEVNGADYTYTNCGFGLFAAASNATFKNLTISGAYVRVECVEAGVLVGLSQNSCTYENIEIHNSKIANYQRPAGGLIGEVSGEGTTTITDVIIGSDVVVGSLWGDFDAPCGGVIGAYWNDVNADPQIVMSYVEVGARMDVYSDVTSAYQWYAYRRAGMLIGNTEQTDKNNKHLAAADFLTCLKDENGNKTVKVYYGDWAAYHYCRFTNQDDSWCNNYPWVRVEEGENCSAYSNPRYGVPVVNGVTVSNMDAKTLEATRTGYEEIRFNQLYGGGQGVYGQPVHDGVEVINYRYSITYVNDYQVLAIKYVTENGAVSTANSAAKDLVEKWASANIKGSWEFGGWMNAGSTKLETIRADNTKDIVLYPYFNKPYTARFVDQQGNVVAWCLFHAEDLTKLDATKVAAEAALPAPGEDLEFDYWEVQITDNNGKVNSREEYSKNSFAAYEQDVTIYPVYKYKGNLRLTPVDSDGDGIINYYQIDGLGLTVSEYNNLSAEEKKAYMTVNIPGEVNGIYVTHIAGDAFSDFADLEIIYIPNTVTYIGTNAFVKKGEDEQITIYYNGTKAEWDAIEKNFASDWDKYIGTGSHIYFTDGSSYEKKGLNGLYTYWK